MLARSSLTLIVALGVTGCETSSYRPANSPRVSTIYENGVLKYQRDGRTYDDVLDAVESDPRAAAVARGAASKKNVGSIFVLICSADAIARMLSASATSPTLGSSSSRTARDTSEPLAVSSLASAAAFSSFLGPALRDRLR